MSHFLGAAVTMKPSAFMAVSYWTTLFLDGHTLLLASTTSPRFTVAWWAYQLTTSRRPRAEQAPASANSSNRSLLRDRGHRLFGPQQPASNRIN